MCAVDTELTDCEGESMKLVTKLMMGVAIVAPMAVQAATTWTMASGYPEDSFLTKNIRQFIKEVEKESGGQLKIDLRSNGTLIKHDAIKRAVQSNQIQLGEIRFGVYGNESAIYNLDGIPNVATTYEEAWKLMEVGKPYFDKLFAKNNMKILSYVPWPGQGFYTKQEVMSPKDFVGKKLRIYSQPTQRMGELLGFEATILPFAEVPQAFATGLINSQYTSAQTGIDTQVWDNCKFYLFTGTQHNKNAIIVNQKALRQLDPKLQKIVVDAGERATKRGWELSEQASKATLKVLTDKGVKVSKATPQIQAAMQQTGVVLMTEWRKTANPEEIAVLDKYLKMVGR